MAKVSGILLSGEIRLLHSKPPSHDTVSRPRTAEPLGRIKKMLHPPTPPPSGMKSQALGLTFDDGAFIELAIQDGIALVTLDSGMRQTVAAGVDFSSGNFSPTLNDFSPGLNGRTADQRHLGHAGKAGCQATSGKVRDGATTFMGMWGYQTGTAVDNRDKPCRFNTYESLGGNQCLGGFPDVTLENKLAVSVSGDRLSRPHERRWVAVL